MGKWFACKHGTMVNLGNMDCAWAEVQTKHTDRERRFVCALASRGGDLPHSLVTVEVDDEGEAREWEGRLDNMLGTLLSAPDGVYRFNVSGIFDLQRWSTDGHGWVNFSGEIDE